MARVLAPRCRLTMADGTIAHCEVSFGNSVVNLGQSMEGWPAHSLVAQIFVEDSDALFARAVAAGASVVMPMTDIATSNGSGRALSTAYKEVSR